MKWLVLSDKIVFFICLAVTIYTSLMNVDNNMLYILQVCGYSYVLLITSIVFAFSKQHRDRIVQWFDYIFLK